MPNLKTWAPAIAIVLIFALFAIAKFVILPARQIPTATPPPATEAAAPAMPAAPSKPAPALTPAPQSADVPPPAPVDVPAATTWPTYHGGPDLCGYSDHPLPDTPFVLWQYLAEGNALTPVGDDHAIYIATAKGNVLSLDFNGAERWKKLLTQKKSDGSDIYARIDAPIAVFGGTVFVGAAMGTLHALDANTGESRWNFQVSGGILGSVNYDPPRDANDFPRVLVLQREDGIVYCLNASTGEKLWQTDPVARCDGSPGLVGGVVIWGACDSLFHLHDAAKGLRLNTVEPGGECQIASGPAIAGGEFYSGSRCGKFLRVRISDAKILWSNTDAQKEIFSTPAITKDKVVFGSEDHNVYALDRATGKQLWRHDAGGIPLSPVVAGDTVAIAVDGALKLLKLDSGEQVWEHEVSDSIASPALIDGKLIAASEDGTIVAFGEKAAAP